ncbi:MAG: hypothetical protein WB496_25370, partial [Pseudolabrys sp.]
REDLADNPGAPAFVRYRSNSGRWSALAAANYPKRTSATELVGLQSNRIRPVLLLTCLPEATQPGKG